MEEFLRSLAHRYGFERLVAVDKDDYVDLQVMVLPEPLRGRGRGTKFMTQVCDEADRRGTVIGTCPEPLFTGWTPEDKARLIRWYQRFGFVESTDKSIYRVTYVRMPKIKPPNTPQLMRRAVSRRHEH